MVSVATARVHPLGSDRAAHSVPPCLGSSLMGCINICRPRIQLLGFRSCTWRLTYLVYADDICLLAGSPRHMQALIDALVGYCATLHMEISVAKTKVMVVSTSLATSPSLEAAVSLAMVFWWSRLTLLNTWDYTFVHQGVYPTLSHL